MRSRKYDILGALLPAAAMAMLSACGDGNGDRGTVRGGIAVTDRIELPLERGSIDWVSGTYGGGCDDHEDGDAWSIVVDEDVDPDAPTPNAELTVEFGDETCTLTLTEVVAGGEVYTPEGAGIILSSTLSSPTAFRPEGANLDDDPVSFYLSARLEGSAGFENDFVVEVTHTDDVNDDTEGGEVTVTPNPD